MKKTNFFNNIKLIAHRGIHNNINLIQNTIPAFKEAIKQNLPIELDVHLTKDNKIVVVHDSNLINATKKDIIVEKSTYDEIKDLKLYNSKETIPLFIDVLKIVNGNVPLIIEIKNNKIPGKLEKELLNTLNKYNGDFVIQSFNPLVLLWFKIHDNSIIRGQLSAHNIRDAKSKILNYLLKKMVLNFITKPNFISYQYKDIDEKLYNYCKRKNIILIGWTLKNKEESANAYKYCDSIIFDYFIDFKNINN